MKHKKWTIGTSRVDYYLDGSFAHLRQITDPSSTILITDEQVAAAHAKKFRNWRTLILPPGEEHKTQATADLVIRQLIEWEADRKTTLVGVGGGVITDLTGYVASIYMRGIRFGFVPTTVLALVDASIGGKNGVDVGPYKNLAGLIRQPAFLLHDLSLLKTLPEKEWINGFAEIIKHACIRDASMFKELESRQLGFYQKSKKALAELIERNTQIKTKVVQMDEGEKKERRLLNFGHTLGHALETQYTLSHGQAVAIGMDFAARLSVAQRGFKEADRVAKVIQQYGLPVSLSYDPEKVFQVLKMDKKRERKEINYVLLDRIGKGVIQSLPLEKIRSLL